MLDSALEKVVMNVCPNEVLLIQVRALLKCTSHGLVYRITTFTKQEIDAGKSSDAYITLLGLESFAEKLTSKFSAKMLFIATDASFS